MNLVNLACSFAGADVTVECPYTGSTYRFTIIVDRKLRAHIGGHFAAWGMTDRALAFWVPFDACETAPELPCIPWDGSEAPKWSCLRVLNLQRASRDPWFADLAGQITRNYLEN